MWPFAKHDVANELKRRNIELLLHSTNLTINLPQIFEDGFIDTARGLRERLGARAERLLHDPRRLEKFSVGIDYINCSISVPNYELLYARSKSAWQSEWIHFVLDKILLVREDTLFCPVSAAQDFGKHVQPGLTGFQAMFVNRVDSWTRESLADHEPTHPQAEVLIKGRLSFESISEILVSNSAVAHEAERLAEHYRRIIPVRIEPKLFIWPKRLKKHT